MNHESIKAILANWSQITNTERRWLYKPSMSARETARGLSVSRNATEHPSEVPVTPLMQNLLEGFGDIDESGDLLTGSPETRAEKWVYETVEQILLQQTTKKLTAYDNTLPMRDVQHYYVDCWLNWDRAKLRDIQEGQVEEINEMILDNYVRPTKALKLQSKLRTDPVFQKAVEAVVDHLPTVSATRQIREVNLPFMTKHTNVGYVPGYEGFGNDRTTVPGTDETYAQLTMRIAETIKDHPELLNKYNITTEFSRYQRGKGRLIQAAARIINLVLNQLNSVEVENYKARSALFAGYNDDEYLQMVMNQMLAFCERHNLVAYNIDYHRFDAHVVKEMVELIGAVSMYKCADERSRKLALYRAVLMTRTWLVAGTLDRVVEVYGRIFSGFIDTNRAGGLINATAMTYLIMKQNDHYVRDIVSQILWYMLVMGDDVLAIVDRKFSLSQVSNDALEELNFEIDDMSKIAFGIKFLQFRLFEWRSRLIMIYPWTRVVRGMLFKERSKGLGPAGWALAFYQQLAKLIQGPEFLAAAVNIVAVCDKQRLMLDKSIDEINEMCRKEDAEALAKAPETQKRRIKSTIDSLYDGDPSKARQFVKVGDKLEINTNYFTEVQNAIRSVYDPDYLPSHGISIPPLKR